MKNKYVLNLVMSSIFLVYTSIFFYIFTISPLIDLYKGQADEGHILIIFTIPISSALFIASFCFFLISLMKFINNRNTHK